MDKFIIKQKKHIDQLPKTAGVYCFFQKRETIYIGKAINIKDRVKSHFFQPSYRDNLFMAKVERIGFIETGSEIEALILEAHLIKKYQPKFNVVWRDDKNYFYVAIRYFTPQGKLKKDKIPYIFITHQPNLTPNTKHLTPNYIGPFIEGNAIKKALKFLRRVFPFYTSERHPQNKCTWCHLGLCPGPELFENPPSPKATAGLREYKKNIKKLILVLRGERKNALHSLKREMQILAKNNSFEEAGKIRDKMQALEKVMAHKNVLTSQINPKHTDWNVTQGILKRVLRINKDISRIECYDISNIQGKQATGSMVVFIDGKPDKDQYKKFRIRGENSSPTNFEANVKNKKLGREINYPKLVGDKPNDIAMLQEVITRRLHHPEWPYPEVMLIDGGIAQLNVAIKAKTEYPLKMDGRPFLEDIKNIKVISIAKRYKELHVEGKKQPILLKTLPQDIYNLIIHLDDEAHRFAISYHKLLRSKKLMEQNT